MPAVAAGVENVSEVDEFTVTDAAGTVVPPIVTEVLPATKFVPVIVADVPPAIGPYTGDKETAVGAESYVKPPAIEELVPPDVDTVTATFPAACAGVENVRDVDEFTVTEPVGTVVPPIVTEVSPITKFVPLIVTIVPPALCPSAGLIELAVGAAS